MKKKGIIFVVLMLVILSCFVGCINEENAVETPKFTVSIVDTMWDEKVGIHLCNYTDLDDCQCFHDNELLDVIVSGYENPSVFLSVGSSNIIFHAIVEASANNLAVFMLDNTSYSEIKKISDGSLKDSEISVLVLHYSDISIDTGMIYKESLMLSFSLYSNDNFVRYINKSIPVYYVDIWYLTKLDWNLSSYESIELYYSDDVFTPFETMNIHQEQGLNVSHLLVNVTLENWYKVNGRVVNHVSPWLSYDAVFWYIPMSNRTHLEKVAV